MNNGPKFEYYAVCYDFNKKECEMFNVFRNSKVYEHTLREVKKHLRNKKKYPFEAFVEEIREIIMWQEWSRVEYECSVGDPFPRDVDKFKKIDCYWQAEPNMRMIAEMVISRYREWKKENGT